MPLPAAARRYRRSWLRGDLLAGVTVAAGLLRLGFLADLLSRPVLVGYLTGVALLMIAGQLGAATGVPVTGEEFLPQVTAFASHLGDARLVTTLLSVAVLAFLFAMRARWPRGPGPLLAVMLATAAVALFGLQRHGVRVTGTIPVGLPAPAAPVLRPATLGQLALPAFSVFIVDFTALEALDQVRDELARDGVVLALARVKQDLLVRLEAFGLAKKIGPGLLFPTLPSAVDAYRHWAEAHPRQDADGGNRGTASGAGT